MTVVSPSAQMPEMYSVPGTMLGDSDTTRGGRLGPSAHIVTTSYGAMKHFSPFFESLGHSLIHAWILIPLPPLYSPGPTCPAAQLAAER